MKVLIRYLEMTRPGQLQPSRRAPREVVVRQVREDCPEINRFFYETIGKEWQWVDRLVWTEDQWLAHVRQPGLTTWIGYLANTPFGFFELDTDEAGQVEIAIFGVLSRFVGRGLGGYLITEAARTAWGLGAKRVWLHTCSLDHPAALANYRSRGFVEFKEEVREFTSAQTG